MARCQVLELERECHLGMSEQFTTGFGGETLAFDEGVVCRCCTTSEKEKPQDWGARSGYWSGPTLKGRIDEKTVVIGI